MKAKIVFIVLIATFLVSCDAIKDLFSTDIETTLEMSVPVSVTANPIALKSADGILTSYPFSKTGTLALDENDDAAEYIDRIKEVNINSIDAAVLGLTSGQVIETLTLSVTGIGTILTLSNITSTSVITPNVSQAILDQIGAKLKSDLAITATVAGTSNYAPMNFSLNLEFDTVIKAGL